MARLILIGIVFGVLIEIGNRLLVSIEIMIGMVKQIIIQITTR